MNSAIDSIWLLLGMAFTLGLRHGFDLDHIATIDSITRTVKQDARLSNYVGLLFSLGHGMVVILLCLIVSSGFIKTQTPTWLETFGHWVSIVFLWLFGLLTLWGCLKKSTTRPMGLKGRFLIKLLGERLNAWVILCIGALFAFSFDTYTQVALFSISTSMLAGWFLTILLGAVFMIGMMTSDGLNGLFVSKIIQAADKKSVSISRALGFLIASFSLTLGVLGLNIK